MIEKEEGMHNKKKKTKKQKKTKTEEKAPQYK